MRVEFLKPVKLNMHEKYFTILKSLRCQFFFVGICFFLMFLFDRKQRTI